MAPVPFLAALPQPGEVAVAAAVALPGQADLVVEVGPPMFLALVVLQELQAKATAAAVEITQGAASIPAAAAVAQRLQEETAVVVRVAKAEVAQLAALLAPTSRMQAVEVAAALVLHQALAVQAVVEVVAFTTPIMEATTAQQILVEVEAGTLALMPATVAPASSLSATQFFNNGTLRTA
jgi:hypothetical protein